MEMPGDQNAWSGLSSGTGCDVRRQGIFGVCVRIGNIEKMGEGGGVLLGLLKAYFGRQCKYWVGSNMLEGGKNEGDDGRSRQS